MPEGPTLDVPETIKVAYKAATGEDQLATLLDFDAQGAGKPKRSGAPSVLLQLGQMRGFIDAIVGVLNPAAQGSTAGALLSLLWSPVVR